MGRDAWLTLLLLEGAVGPAAFALERSDLRFSLSFERGLQPEIAIGDTEITCSAGRLEEVPFDPAGLRGRAVKLNEALNLTYRNAQMFSRKEGTISFWLKPLGWKAGSGKNHHFLFAYPDNCGFQIYRFYPGNNWAYLFPSNDPRTWRFVGGGKWWDGWEDGEWQHVAFTFKPGEQALYFGGRLHERKGTDLVEPEFGENSGITLAAANPGTEQAFDEVILFRRALSEPEVRSLAREPAQTPPTVAVPRMDAPVVDGKITSASEWARGLTLAAWVDPVLGTANADETRVQVAHSGTALHVCFRYPIPERFRQQRDRYGGSPLRVSVREEDGDLCQDDYVGVILSPPAAGEMVEWWNGGMVTFPEWLSTFHPFTLSPFRHFTIAAPGQNERERPGAVYFFGLNGAGARRDERNGDPAWDGDWQARQAHDDQVWTAEFSIPFATFGATSAGDWGVNFAHGSRQMDLQEGLTFYQPRQQWPLARMVLSPDAPSVSLTGLRSLADGRLELRVRIANPGPTPLSAQGEVHLRGSTELTDVTEDRTLFTAPLGPLTVPPGTAEVRTAAHLLAEPLCGEAVLSLSDNAGRSLLAYTLPFVFSRELALKVRYYPTPARLEAVLDAGSSATLARLTGARVAIVPEGGGEALQSTSLDRFDGLRQEVEFDCRSLPVGTYEVVAEFRLGERTVTLKDRLVKEPPPEWLGNRLGTLTAVPPPWTPLRLRGRTVSCWGRDYTFGAAGLPAQVRVLGQDLLAGPARLWVTFAGRPQAVPLGRFQVTEATPLKVAFTASGRRGPLTVSSEAWIEFDGFYHNTLTLSADRPLTVESVAIEVPLKPRFATYWSPAEYYPVQLGRSPTEEQESEVRPGLRLGDEERGLQFSFVNAHKQILRPGDREYGVRYEFLNAPTRIEQPYRLTFGLQALPVRPRSPLYRRFRVDDCTFSSDPSKELFYISPLYAEGWSGHWNYLNFWNEQAFEPAFKEQLRAAYAAMWEQRRQTHCMYLNITATDANTPEYRAYRYEWAGQDAPDPPPYDPATKMKPQMVSINPATPSYEDFYVWYLDKAVRYLTDNGRFPIHCYFDVTAPHRRFMKRVYAVMKAIHPLNQIFVHMSGDNNMYAWAFADWLIEGEENTANYLARMANDPTLPEDYTHILDVPKVASRYSPFAFGDKFFLYQFWGWKNSEPARAHLWSLLFVHDGTTWAAGGPAHKQALIDLGWDDRVEFIPYWRKDNGLTV